VGVILLVIFISSSMVLTLDFGRNATNLDLTWDFGRNATHWDLT